MMGRTGIIEQAFSAINIVTIRLCNKMEDNFLTNYWVIYIDEEIAENFSTKMLIDDLYSLKHSQVPLL